MEITAAQVKELRERTGAGFMDCKKALQESSGNLDKAIEYLRLKGLARAEKKAGRATKEGLIVSYIHPGNRIGVLLEVNCETDFAAKTEDFKDFARNVAMQIAATSPLAVTREELSEELIERERGIYRKQALQENKPPHVVEKIVEGKLEKFFSETCLIDQVYIRDTDRTVKELLNELIAKIGENVRISRFARFQLGQ